MYVRQREKKTWNEISTIFSSPIFFAMPTSTFCCVWFNWHCQLAPECVKERARESESKDERGRGQASERECSQTRNTKEESFQTEIISKRNDSLPVSALGVREWMCCHKKKDANAREWQSECICKRCLSLSLSLPFSFFLSLSLSLCLQRGMPREWMHRHKKSLLFCTNARRQWMHLQKISFSLSLLSLFLFLSLSKEECKGSECIAKNSYTFWLTCKGVRKWMHLQRISKDVKEGVNMYWVSAHRMHDTGWRRPIGCLKLQVIPRKRATNQRATNYRALLRKMTYKDKASYASSPPCTHDCVMSQTSRIHVAHVNESCRTFQPVTSRTPVTSRIHTHQTNQSHHAYIHTRQNEGAFRYHAQESCTWVMPHIWKCHVTLVKASCRISESCRAFEWVVSHMWMSHVSRDATLQPFATTPTRVTRRDAAAKHGAKQYTA